jgi:hypothetical protein
MKEYPMSDQQKTAEPDAYVVAHSAVGRFWRGQQVTAADLGAPNGPLEATNLQRLLDLGAIAPVGSRQATDTLSELGPDHQTPQGDRIDDPEAVRRQVGETYASLGKPVPTG